MGKSDQNATTNEAEKKEFRAWIAEHERFNSIQSTVFISSTELCQKISEWFKATYVDFYGCTFEISQQGRPFISLFFDHAEASDEARPNAITKKKPEKDRVQNETVLRIRENDRRNYSGDKWYLTEEGSQGLDDYVSNQMINSKNGNVQWEKITAEVSMASNYFGQPPTIYTKISMIDPEKLITEIYGSTDEDGNNLVYGLRVLRSLPQMLMNGSFQPQFMCAIDCVAEKEVVALCNKLGIAPTGNLDIIR